jgi:hypothetical protein
VSIQLDTRNVFLSALVALVVLAGALLVLAPTASANRSDCPLNTVCLWEGPTFGGDRAFFSENDEGCKPLNNIDPKSGYNRADSAIVSLSGGLFYSVLWPGDDFENLSDGYDGQICIDQL